MAKEDIFKLLDVLGKEIVEAESYAAHRRNNANEGNDYDVWNQIARLNKNMDNLIEILKSGIK